MLLSLLLAALSFADLITDCETSIRRHFPLATVCNLKHTGGLSGDLLFLVCDPESGQKQAIVKAMITQNRDSDFRHTLRSQRKLEEIQTAEFKPVSLIFAEEGQSFHLIGQSIATGTEFRAYLKDRGALAQALQAARTLSRALSRLHQAKTAPILSTKGTYFGKIYAKLVRALDSTKADQTARDIYEMLWQDFLKNPGVFSYVHGDPNPGNFFVTPDGPVVLIDTAGLSRALTRDEQEDPRGIAALEIHQLITSLEIMGYPLSQDEIVSVQKALRDAYSNPDLTPEANRFFEAYWRLRTSEFHLNASSQTFRL